MRVIALAVINDRVVSALAELLDIIAHTPRLDGALCRGRPSLFDIEDARQRTAVKAAIELCECCPALDACRDWLDSLPPASRPVGVVVAGVLLHPQRDQGASDPG